MHFNLLSSLRSLRWDFIFTWRNTCRTDSAFNFILNNLAHQKLQDIEMHGNLISYEPARTYDSMNEDCPRILLMTVKQNNWSQGSLGKSWGAISGGAWRYAAWRREHVPWKVIEHFRWVLSHRMCAIDLFRGKEKEHGMDIDELSSRIKPERY